MSQRSAWYFDGDHGFEGYGTHVDYDTVPTLGRLRSNSLSERCMVLFVKSGNGFPHTASACFRQEALTSSEAPVHMMRTAGLSDGFCSSKARM